MNSFLSLAGGWLPIIIAFVPLLIGLLVKSTASQQVKSVVMIVVTGLVTLGSQVEASGGILTKDTAVAWVFSIIVAISTFYGVWKPIGLGNIAPDKGIG